MPQISFISAKTKAQKYNKKPGENQPGLIVMRFNPSMIG